MKSDKEIMQLLESDPNAGMVQVMEQYLKLVHSIAAGLKNPEDVKDCINDTFADFYRYRNSFDPDKGSLDNYLAAITRRNLADIAARNKKHAAEEYPDGVGIDPVSDWDRQIDMENAIQSLSSMDAALIRMKYYQGKSLQEIANSLGISYEATKKRHQRSLAALKKALIAMLILSLLAALASCAYIALRYFGIIPGYGIQTDPNVTQYVLSDGETVQSDHFRITVVDAWIRDGSMDIRILFEWTDPDSDIHMILQADDGKTWFHQIQLGDGIAGELVVSSLDFDWESGTFTATCILHDPQLIQDEEGMICVLLFDGAQIRFRVSEADAQELEQTGYSVVTENGGFHALPRIEDGRLYVQIYPIDPDNFIIDPMLSSHYMKYRFGLSGDVTATAEDGTVLTGSIIRNAEQVSGDFYEWDFGEAKPGEYQLYIPFAFIYREMTGEELLATRSVLSFTGGEAVTITLPDGTITLGPVQALGQNGDGLYRWCIPTETGISCAYRLLSADFVFTPKISEPLSESLLVSWEETVSEDGITGYECSCAAVLSEVQIRLSDVNFLWECDMTIPFQVDG